MSNVDMVDSEKLRYGKNVIWGKGFLAGSRGKERKCNYKKGSMAYCTWVNGWEHGRKEYEVKGDAPPVKHIPISEGE